MKTNSILATVLLAFVTLTSCSSDDDTLPEAINPEEIITTMTVTLNSPGETEIKLVSRDLDGQDGPNSPVLEVSGPLKANTLYSGTVLLENETESPVEVTNEEIQEEADQHQFFFQSVDGVNITTSYADKESDYITGGTNKPVGLKFNLQTGEASTDALTVTLRHQPKKDAENVSNGDITNAAGETDITQTFTVEIK